jgi:hypothetical protein
MTLPLLLLTRALLLLALPLPLQWPSRSYYSS